LRFAQCSGVKKHGASMVVTFRGLGNQEQGGFLCGKDLPQIQSLVLAHGRRWDEEMKGERRRAGGSTVSQ